MTRTWTPAELIALNNDFYRQQAESFSRTRQHFWPGWSMIDWPATPAVLDVAAGNLRLYQFLTERAGSGGVTDKPCAYLGIDASQPLLETSGLSSDFYQVVDILHCLQTDQDWTQFVPKRDWSVIFCSAFFHHVPLAAWRERLLDDFYDLCAPGGLIVVSFWRFMPKLAHLVVNDLGGGDYVLNWQKSGRLRFAHQCLTPEIADLVEHLASRGARVHQDFLADGRNQRLNRYVVWRKP